MATDVHSALPLAPRDLLILSVLAAGPLHGYGVIKAVEERSASGVLLDPANLYRTLRRMRLGAWIEEVEESADAGSERRRTFALTALGRDVLRAEVDRLEGLLEHARPAVARAGEQG